MAEWQALVGRQAAVSEWVQISQAQIDSFAELTGDRQWIHVDPERARRESPYGGPIAHGFLTLSLLSRLFAEATSCDGARVRINYGLNRVRFPAPVPAGSRVRARFILASAEEIAGGVQAVWDAALHVEGAEKPSLVAEWVVRYYYG